MYVAGLASTQPEYTPSGCSKQAARAPPLARSARFVTDSGLGCFTLTNFSGSLTSSLGEPRRDLPRRRPISWMVRSKTAEPSTLEAHIMEGSIFRSEPSTLEPDIVEGSGEAGRTIHVNAPFRGRFSIQKQTFHAEDRYRGWYKGSRANPPR